MCVDDSLQFFQHLCSSRSPIDMAIASGHGLHHFGLHMDCHSHSHCYLLARASIIASHSHVGCHHSISGASASVPWLPSVRSRNDALALAAWPFLLRLSWHPACPTQLHADSCGVGSSTRATSGWSAFSSKAFHLERLAVGLERRVRLGTTACYLPRSPTHRYCRFVLIANV